MSSVALQHEPKVEAKGGGMFRGEELVWQVSLAPGGRGVGWAGVTRAGAVAP